MTKQRWVRVAELVCVLLLGAHLLFGPRDTVLELAVFSVLSLLVFTMNTHGLLPAAPERRSAWGVWGLLAAFTAVSGVSMILYGVSRDVTPTLSFAARTAAVYLLYAYLQQNLTQRYLVVRVHSWLRRPASGLTAGAVAILFGVLHLPWPYLIPPTVAAGFVWSYAFLRGGRVWPIALSHAALAVAFFGFVTGHDPFTEIFGDAVDLPPDAP